MSVINSILSQVPGELAGIPGVDECLAKGVLPKDLVYLHANGVWPDVLNLALSLGFSQEQVLQMLHTPIPGNRDSTRSTTVYLLTSYLRRFELLKGAEHTYEEILDAFSTISGVDEDTYFQLRGGGASHNEAKWVLLNWGSLEVGSYIYLRTAGLSHDTIIHDADNAASGVLLHNYGELIARAGSREEALAFIAESKARGETRKAQFGWSLTYDIEAYLSLRRQGVSRENARECLKMGMMAVDRLLYTATLRSAGLKKAWLAYQAWRTPSMRVAYEVFRDLCKNARGKGPL